MVNIAHFCTSCMEGTSLTPCTTASNRQDGVMGLEYPRGCQMHRSKKTGLVWLATNDDDFDFDLVSLQDHRGAADGELADAATRKAAPEDDALGILPPLELEEPPRDQRELASTISQGR
jgi:hypothetical protein